MRREGKEGGEGRGGGREEDGWKKKLKRKMLPSHLAIDDA